MLKGPENSQGNICATAPAEPHPHAPTAGTNSVILHHICFKYSQDQRNHLMSCMLYLYLPLLGLYLNFQSVSTETRNKSNRRTRRAPQSVLLSCRDKACTGVLQRR